MYLTGAGNKHTRTILSCVFQWLQQRHCLVTLTLQKNADPSYMVHITFQGVSLKVLAWRLMVSYYRQTVDSLSPANSRNSQRIVYYKCITLQYIVTIFHLIRD
jgi:hypothetical protein